MRGIIAAIATSCALVPCNVHADVSHDLVFCSKLASSRERIACYDAAARIAERSMQPSASPPQSSKALPGALQPALVALPDRPSHGTPPHDPTTGFQGAYVAVGGSYGAGAPITFFGTDGIQAFSGTATPHGPSFVASGGYNVQAGSAVVGIEFSGRFGDEAFSRSRSVSLNDPTGVIGTSTLTATHTINASGHASLRAGLAFGDTLAFAKVGFGVAHLRQESRSDLSGTNCTAAAFIGGLFACTHREPLSSIYSASDYVLPSLLLGLGIEHNIGQFFGRIEAEAEAVTRITQPDLYWTARAMASVGIRF